MYAELFPSAQSFISSVLLNVKFAVRAMETPTGPARRNCSWPAWIAEVASPHRFVFAGFFMCSRIAQVGRESQAPNWFGAQPQASTSKREEKNFSDRRIWDCIRGTHAKHWLYSSAIFLKRAGRKNAV